MLKIPYKEALVKPMIHFGMITSENLITYYNYYIYNPVYHFFYEDEPESPFVQSRINYKLKKFLLVLGYLDESSIYNNYESLNDGCCFGLSVCYEYMALTGKLKWWKAALRAISTWDENRLSLNNKIVLPNSEEKGPVILKKLFERCLNYILFHHNIYNITPEYIDYKGLSEKEKFLATQFDLFNLKARHFEFIHQGVIQTPKYYENIGCHFSHQNLKSIINIALVKNSICILTSHSHAIGIRYSIKKKQWYLYDPDSLSRKLHQKFSSKRKFIHAIINILGHDITIGLVKFNVPKKSNSLESHFLKLFSKNNLKLLYGSGLHSLYFTYSPLVEYILKRIREEKNSAVILQRALCRIIFPFESGLMRVADIALEHLSIFFTIVQKHPKGSKLLSKVLRASLKLILKDDRIDIFKLLMKYGAKLDQVQQKVIENSNANAIKQFIKNKGKPFIKNTANPFAFFTSHNINSLQYSQVNTISPF
ncbi:hypothetical protein [Legionella busanensis]|nr:hypothetical protein [Legionella busanensis]